MLSVALVPLVLLASACGSGTSSATATAAVRPLPAGRLPSPIALMVCQHKVHGEINQVLGVNGHGERPDVGRSQVLVPLRLPERVVRVVGAGALELAPNP